MRLYCGKLSPFVRKVKVLAHEKSLVKDLELAPAPLTPTEPNADLMVVNPLGALADAAFAPSDSLLTIGEIAAGCALGWIDFRLPQLAWRAGRERLGEWYERFARRPSMLATAPQ